MYRNSAHVKCNGSNALPSPDNTSDSDSDLLDALDQKRRQLDEEVAKFRAAKDREFREFEKELRVKKSRSRGGGNNGAEFTANKSSASTTATASVLNLLALSQNGPANGQAGHKSTKASSLGDKVRKPAPLSGPTLSLDKLNIKGETTPPLHSLGTPPTSSLMKRSRSRSPPNVRPTRPPPSQSGKEEPPPISTPPPSKDHADPFAGVFIPVYLPLLDSRDQRSEVRNPQPLTSAEDEKNRMQLDADSKQHAEQQRLESHSLPPPQASPTVLASKRAKSTSVLPNSTSLPSALRTSNGEGRARKHVMFQLADLKVVDPSSSYQEGPSPEVEESNDPGDKHRLGIRNQEDGDPSKKDTLSPRSGEKDRKRGRGRGGRFVSPMPSPLASPNPSPSQSPALRGTSPPAASPASSPRPIPSPDESGFSGGLSGADDGGSGVGFFELDEELASPALREGKPAEGFDLDIEDELNEKAGRDRRGLETVPSVQVGSVPINIVRNSWVGSYGH